MKEFINDNEGNVTVAFSLITPLLLFYFFMGSEYMAGKICSDADKSSD